jgi:hypothetical protein
VREKVLWSFGANDDGANPFAGLLADRLGNLYGTTRNGGTNDLGGTVFELQPPTGQRTQWSESVLWNFGANDDGSDPVAGLIERSGKLYGTTYSGGTNCPSFPDHPVGGCGTVFELRPPTGQQTQWSERVLWSFGADDDGRYPQGGLIGDRWGMLYGTTTEGGKHEGGIEFEGTVFELCPY